MDSKSLLSTKPGISSTFEDVDFWQYLGVYFLGPWRISINHRRVETEDFLSLVFHGQTWEQQQWRKSPDTRGKRQANKKEDVPTDTLVPIGFPRIIYLFLFGHIMIFFLSIFAFGLIFFFFLTICWGTDCTTESLINAGRGNAGGGRVVGGDVGANSAGPVTPPSTFLLRSPFLLSFNVPLSKVIKNFFSSGD